MSAINQCTFDITGSTRLLQYYRVCTTCSRDNFVVEVCLNCASICHERHRLGPLLRANFSCACHQKTRCCRASFFADQDDQSRFLGKKRRVFNDGGLYATTDFAPVKKFAVWSKQGSQNKVLNKIVYDEESANKAVAKAFFENNPWGLDETAIKALPNFTSGFDEKGIMTFHAVGADGSVWAASSQVLSQFLQDYEPSRNLALPNRRSYDEPNDDEMILFSDTRGMDLHRSHKVSTSSGNITSQDDDLGQAKKLRGRKEVGAPKGPVASFMVFSNEVRDQVLKENKGKGLSMTDISRVIGLMWKKLTPEERAPFEEHAKQDRVRYLKEKEEFMKRKEELGLPTVYSAPAQNKDGKSRGKPGPKPRRSYPKAPNEALLAAANATKVDVSSKARDARGSSNKDSEVDAEGDSDESSSSVDMQEDDRKFVVVSSYGSADDPTYDLELDEGNTYNSIAAANSRAMELFMGSELVDGAETDDMIENVDDEGLVSYTLLLGGEEESAFIVKVLDFEEYMSEYAV